MLDIDMDRVNPAQFAYDVSALLTEIQWFNSHHPFYRAELQRFTSDEFEVDIYVDAPPYEIVATYDDVDEFGRAVSLMVEGAAA